MRPDVLSPDLRADLGTVLAVALALVWLWAAVAKLVRPPTLEQVTAAVPWLLLLPAAVTRTGLRALPVVEGLLALALVPEATRRTAGLASAVVLVGFGLALSSGLVLSSLSAVPEAGPDGPTSGGSAVAACGCFGRRPAPAAAAPSSTRVDEADPLLTRAGWHVARPMLLAAVALVAIVPCGCG